MKRSVKLAVGLAVGGVLIAGGVLGAGTVFASDTAESAAGAPSGQTQSARHGEGAGGCPGRGGTSGHNGHDRGQHNGHDRGEGKGCEHGGKGGGITAESGKLTDAQKATLVSLAEEEKLAYDLYTSFADRYDTQVFDHISQSESRHLDVMRTLLDRYDIDDPTKDQKAGSFTDAKVQKIYDQLLSQGKAGEDTRHWRPAVRWRKPTSTTSPRPSKGWMPPMQSRSTTV